ncbi:hypothetical protein SAMN02745181_1222 [Rubritalea squalenifaciens DSM 18772]|uniref:SGNH hydrolase-type esterase domain-containing protein n=1 Tax=Rubritalea squalenifaciens DSM 18772 TaxID=1123071 RepID=A0A1M6GP55_9BACT|nr:SGNH/GDSL hydrolase family protein [Rubritalea squalenifaciens]SHJ11714.1 hypothetical protein SAMN02745181_1222 [Rubritalea squalenifaciens DSM 18772]
METLPSRQAAAHLLNVASELGSSDVQRLVDGLRGDDKELIDRSLALGSRVGPWQIGKLQDGTFEWALREQTQPVDDIKYRARPYKTHRNKATEKRLLLIGESAAGSWGYFGEYSLASLLEDRMQHALGYPCEVVDLSCVNANWRENCLPMIKAGMTLDPDLVLVYCGNNEARWLMPLLLSQSSGSHIIGGFDLKWNMLKGDVKAMMRASKDVYLKSLEKNVADTVTLCRKFSKPVIFVVPPYNSTSWQPPERVPVHLTSVKLQSWSDFISKAEQFDAESDYTKAMAMLERAIELDEGECQRSQFLMASILQKCGNEDKANKLFEKAAFSGMGAFVGAVPSFPGEAAALLRETCDAFQVPYVDLPRAFKDSHAGEDLFIDYCHLSEAGFEVAVDEVIKVCLESVFDIRVSPDHNQVEGEFAAPVTERGLAYLCAALHGYQNGQSEGEVFKWAERGLNVAPQLIPLYQFLREVLCSYHREWITIDYLRSYGISESILPRRYAVFILKFIYHARFDVSLYNMLGDLIDGVQFDSSYNSQTDGVISYLDGNLKNLFFLDRGLGFGLPQKEMSRRGWERIGNGFVANEPTGVISFPACTSSLEWKYLFLRISPPVPSAEVKGSVYWNGQLLGEIQVNTAFDEFQLKIPDSVTDDSLCCYVDEIKIDWSHLTGPLDIEDSTWREYYVKEYGPYPIAAIIHAVRLIKEPLTVSL